MDDGITPDGQMELRLEAFQDTFLTDLTVEPGTTVTAKYFFGDGDHYVFTVSDAGGCGRPVFSWYQVTKGDFNPHTLNREHRGPTLGLSDLLAIGKTGGNLWREEAMALIGLHEVAAADIQECIDNAVNTAADAAAERLTKRFQQPAEAPTIIDINEHFRVFEAACQLRAPYCDAIEMSWRPDFEGFPGVVFGQAPGTPRQVLYQADPDRSKQLYLNGFWTAEYCLEEDLLERFPDAWARLCARNAARDLLEIQSAGRALMDAQKQHTLQDIDQDKRDRLVRSMEHGRPFADDHSDWDTYAADWLQSECVELFERIREYLGGLKPERQQVRLAKKP